MTPDIAISIINYRTADLTIAAVRSALDALEDMPGRILVVDNASGDGSDEQINDWITATADPRVCLIRSPVNSGFSGGHNQSIAAAPEADFYLILNSDAALRPGFFSPLLDAAAAHPEVGLLAPQLEWEDGKPQVSCFRFASPISELERSAMSGPVTRLFRRHMTSLELPVNSIEIEWMSFACILLRGEMVRQIGPMDEGYFLYFEDAEYSLRARRAGWGVRYVPRARAVHHRGGSSPVKTMRGNKGRIPIYFWRSRTRFLRQAHGPLGPLMANLAWIVGRAIGWSRLLVGRRVPQANAQEWRDIWVGFLTPLKPDRAPE
ncbi:MAG: glycosyltransferase family 2 protein [Pseudomonadota bacterium]